MLDVFFLIPEFQVNISFLLNYLKLLYVKFISNNEI
jgi:hypothetical protein